VRHGTTYSYDVRACRCEECREAKAYARGNVKVDEKLLSDLLHELFPDGLTDDCPARKAAA
jgi:hypothetical protein